MTKNITVRYFASIREAVGMAQEPLQTQAATLGALRTELVARGEPWASCLAEGRAVRMAHNQVMGNGATPLLDGAEAAFFPPVTGG